MINSIELVCLHCNTIYDCEPLRLMLKASRGLGTQKLPAAGSLDISVAPLDHRPEEAVPPSVQVQLGTCPVGWPYRVAQAWRFKRLSYVGH